MLDINDCFENKKVVIDGSNVCWHGTNGGKKARLFNLQLILSELEQLGVHNCNIKVFVDFTLRYQIDNRTQFYKMLKNGIIKETPGGIKAALFILAYCLRHNRCCIISNDFYKEYLDKVPSKGWLDQRQIAFMILDQEVLFISMLEIKLEVVH